MKEAIQSSWYITEHTDPEKSHWDIRIRARSFEEAEYILYNLGVTDLVVIGRLIEKRDQFGGFSYN